jgi:flagellar L-ring protein FlgH
MTRYVTTLFVLATCGLGGAQTAPTNQPAPPANGTQPPAQTPGEAMQRAGGSLLRATVGVAPDPNQAKIGNVSFFAVPEPQPRTLKKHDLVTIIVREESESSSEATADLKKDAAFEAKLEEWIKLSLKNLEIEGGALGPNPPSVKMSASRDFKGEATVDRTDSLLLRVTAEVIDVKPNGTLVLQARQRIKTDEEVQEFTLSGICRAEDVTPDNTILSTQLFDKEVSKSHKGAVKDTTQRGWLPKLLDVINPF